MFSQRTQVDEKTSSEDQEAARRAAEETLGEMQNSSRARLGTSSTIRRQTRLDRRDPVSKEAATTDVDGRKQRLAVAPASDMPLTPVAK